MDIRITQRFAQIGIEWKSAELSIKNPPPDITMQQYPADIIITIERPEVHIDTTQTFSEMGLKRFVPLEMEHAQKSQSIVIDGIGRRAYEGDKLASSIGLGNKVFADIAENNLPQPAEFNVDIIPRTPPKITATGEISIEGVMGDVVVDSPPNFPEVNVQLGYVKTYIEKEPYLKIEAVGNYIDMKI